MERDFLSVSAEILYYEGGEALEQVAHRSCGCLLCGIIQAQIGGGFE